MQILIKQIREHLNISQTELAEQLNVTFARHPSINLPEERLTAIEAQIHTRARELMSIPNSK